MNNLHLGVSSTEKREAIKMEDKYTNGSSLFSDSVSSSYPFSAMFDFCEGEKSSLGFMELLGVQDISPSLFDFPVQTTTTSTLVEPPSAVPNPISTTTKESSEALNQPATPNSSSISSASSEALNEEQTKTVDQEEHDDQQKTEKQ